jgi:hypothetical protein
MRARQLLDLSWIGIGPESATVEETRLAGWSSEIVPQIVP